MTSADRKSAERTFRRIVRQQTRPSADPATDEAGKSIPAPQHMVNQFGNRGRARSARPRPHSFRARHSRRCPQSLIGVQRPVDIEAGPDVVAFSIARLVPGQMAEPGPQPPNEHIGVAAALVARPDRADDRGRRCRRAAARFARFKGRPAPASESGQTIMLDRGRIELVTAEAFGRRFPRSRFGACRSWARARLRSRRYRHGGGAASRRRRACGTTTGGRWRALRRSLARGRGCSSGSEIEQLPTKTSRSAPVE
jgi:hypothetical protein